MSLDDRLTFGDSTLEGLPPETEPETPSGGRPNRAFVFIAIAMGGLILLGILALVGTLVFWVPRQREQAQEDVTRTVEAATQVAAAWTATFTPQPAVQLPTWTPTLVPTWTPIPTATSTRVVSWEDTGPPTATPTKSVSGWTDSTTPQTGLGGFGLVAVGTGLVGLLFAVRRLRSG